MRKLIWKLYNENMISEEVAMMLLDNTTSNNQLMPETVWAFIGMEEIRKYIKYREHVKFVELRCNDLRNKICKQACMHGTVDQTNRKLYIKYNRYLQILKPK